MRSKYKGRKVI